MVTARTNAEAQVMEFFHDGRKIGEAPAWETIMRRRELQAEIDALQPSGVDTRTPIDFKPDGTPVYRRRRTRRAA